MYNVCETVTKTNLFLSQNSTGMLCHTLQDQKKRPTARMQQGLRANVKTSATVAQYTMHGSLLLHSLSYVHTQWNKVAHGSHNGRSWSTLYQAKPMHERQVRLFADSRVSLLMKYG